MTTLPPFRSRVRELRDHRGWTQTELGARVGLTRQSLSAIETGASVPSADVALRIARALGVGFDEVFRLDDECVPEEIVRVSRLGAGLPGRVRTATVAGRRWAYGLDVASAAGSGPADGLGEPVDGGRARLHPFAERPAAPDLVVAGCDPSFGLVKDRLARDYGVEVLWLRASSRRALDALADGAVHVAGVHLHDPDSGTYNRPWIERLVPVPVTRIAFATWEQTLLVAPGNPLGIAGPGDLARPSLRFVNREPGSGSRALVERALAEHGLEAVEVPGFLETAADGHETVARAIASGTAHAGVAIRAVAGPLGLEAIPLAEEPYELVVPERFVELPAVDALLRVLRHPATRRQVEALSGYDAAGMGHVA